MISRTGVHHKKHSVLEIERLYTLRVQLSVKKETAISILLTTLSVKCSKSRKYGENVRKADLHSISHHNKKHRS
jgi:hypothetical protein